RYALSGVMYPPMSTRRTTKKTPLKDWHPADIKAALEKAGWSLRRLSLHHGYKPTTLKEALHRRYPKAERLIADAIGVDPDTIWPSSIRSIARPVAVRHMVCDGDERHERPQSCG